MSDRTARTWSSRRGGESDTFQEHKTEYLMFIPGDLVCWIRHIVPC
jgi:hypothetical protein